MKVSEFLYSISSIRMQNIFISVYALKQYSERYLGSYKYWLSYYDNNERLNYNGLKKQQEIELKKLLRYACESSEYYRQKYKGLKIRDVRSVSDLEILPVMEKDEYRKNINKIYTVKKHFGVASYTGGTTGKSLSLISTKNDFNRKLACVDNFKFKHGVSRKDRSARFSGRKIIPETQREGVKVFWRDNYIQNQRLYSTFHMTENNLRYYIEDLNKFKPIAIDGFVSALYDLANFIETSEIQLNFKPKAIFTTSEALLSFHREKIGKIFGCKVYDQYSSAEGATFVTECERGSLHYRMDTGVIENINTEKGVITLITSFINYGTPIIRYRIGDNVVLSKNNCSCGSCFPVVEKIDGRSVDYLVGKAGHKISLSHLADVIKGLPGCIKNMQFVQIDDRYILVKVVVDTSIYSNKHEKSILRELAYRFGDSIKLKIEVVSQIDKLKSGKHALVIKHQEV